MRDILFDATNVYRTKNYIVRQVIEIDDDGVEGANSCSYDTYFRHTKKRDADYEKFFSERKRIDGKRIPTTMFSRDYVD